MLLCEVLGQVWGARQAAGLSGVRLLVVRPLELDPGGGTRQAPGRLVAADELGAGPGELVLVAHGSRCRDLTLGAEVPTKEVVVAIVDAADVGRGRPERDR